MEAPGLMMQMDGSPHLWFGDKKHCLITMIDDATSEVYAEFFPSEPQWAAWKSCEIALKQKAFSKRFMWIEQVSLVVQNAAISHKCNEHVKS